MTDRVLAAGDVIRTHPRDGFWGCAVVLAAYAAHASSEARCHIATTPVIFRRPFSMADLASEDLSVLVFEQHYRPKPEVDLAKDITCITLYPNIEAAALDVIGKLDPALVYSGPLSQSIGRGPGEYPLARRLEPDWLGMEAVIAWRRTHDRAAQQAEEAAADAEYFAREEARLAKARALAKARRERKRAT